MQPDQLKNVSYPADRRKPVTLAERVTVDFVEILRFLRSRGYGINTIAMYVSVSRTSVRDYGKGATPSHPQGERIIKFWCEITGNSRDVVPTKREGATLTVSHL